jgi:hypothetical protein
MSSKPISRTSHCLYSQKFWTTTKTRFTEHQEVGAGGFGSLPLRLCLPAGEGRRFPGTESDLQSFPSESVSQLPAWDIRPACTCLIIWHGAK